MDGLKTQREKTTENTETNAGRQIEKSPMEIGIKDGETEQEDKHVWW